MDFYITFYANFVCHKFTKEKASQSVFLILDHLISGNPNAHPLGPSNKLSILKSARRTGNLMVHEMFLLIFVRLCVKEG